MNTLPNQGPEPAMSQRVTPIAIVAAEAPPRARPSNYPPLLASLMNGREKRPLGERFGLTRFGVNYTVLAPGAISAFRHCHSQQDEFVYVLAGHPTLITDAGRVELAPGQCAGFPAGTGNAHQIRNDGAEAAVYLEIGDRTPGDEVRYPDDDLAARVIDGQWIFSHKDGTPY